MGPIDPLVAQQLLRQGHVGATSPLGAAAMGLAGEGRGGGFGSPAPPTGRVGAMATVIAPTVVRTAPEGPTPMETGAPAMGRRRTSGRPGCQVQRKRKVVSRGTAKRGLWPRPVLATCGQGRPASPDLLISFIIFRAAPPGRVALTCPLPLRTRRGQPPLRGRTLCVEH